MLSYLFEPKACSERMEQTGSISRYLTNVELFPAVIYLREIFQKYEQNKFMNLALKNIMDLKITLYG